MTCLHIVVEGVVQGVGFRPFIYRIATSLKLKGYVKNLGNGTVEIFVDGDDKALSLFLDDLQHKKPPLAKIYRMQVEKVNTPVRFEGFTILESSKNGSEGSSIIPADVSICDRCLDELYNPSNRRYRYFFITCTDCGPRFTIIKDMPYDRYNTTMHSFTMCDECRAEYTNPLDRRFHAQTVACNKCGPRVYLVSRDGEYLECKDPIVEAARLIDEGYIVAIKGNGGFHLASATTNSEPIRRLRRSKHRAQKPFAIMARDLATVKGFAIVTKKEEELLTSPIRPIVLLKKSDNYYLSDEIAPGLHNIGTMLPYTGLHSLLLSSTKEPALVMTSANPSGEPIIIDNEEAIKRLSNDVDYFLMHDREIAQRCDDSVVKVIGGQQSLLRRSRGYVPEPIEMGFKPKYSVLGLGAELNVASCINVEHRAYLTQHIGDVEHYNTYLFLKNAVKHLSRLLKADISKIACDLHPNYLTTKLAKEMVEEKGLQLVRVQHHHAHIASVMAEHGLDEAIGISVDGAGYGPDGTVWGGEIIYCGHGGFRRIGHLQTHPMPGGDLATKYPVRMAAAILSHSNIHEEWLKSVAHRLPYGYREVEVILKMLKTHHNPLTSSCGRVLDSVSAILGICFERTYEGEPAMKLEAAAYGGKDVLGLKPQIEGNVIKTSPLVEMVFEYLGKYRVKDLAYSAQEYIARGLAELAVDVADTMDVKCVALSGGVAYNEHITSTIGRIVEDAKLNFYTNTLVPCGDGGISLGQVFIACHTP
ncbi:MAG: carbamoyltransferase HypF [Nitrososphaerota archaeon]|nr:carbamoyltransferase HypF [Nitrososphaerales archaeon]MDW8044777.1 carbamoyltransferase HypF [Nitrososphaerota archaeon]